MTKTIIKTHTPKFKGDVPSDWVPGTNTRWKYSYRSWCPWNTPKERLAWVCNLTYEYEVEVEEESPIDDETLANRIFADIKEMKDRGFYFVGKKDSVKEFINIDEIEVRKCITYKRY